MEQETEVNPKKVVLLYSGGLDTSVMLKWIQEKYGCELVTVTLDIGQKTKDFAHIKEKALKLGAVKAFVIDAKKEFADNFVAKAIKANALYEDMYPVSTSIARPLLSEHAIKIAKQEGADAIAHGCSGKGNDQVRFDISIQTLAPGMKVIAPVREWSMLREDEIEYAKKHNIPVPVTVSSPYSVDENLWGKSSECGIIEYPDKEVPKDVLTWVTDPSEAPNKPEYVMLKFEHGIPVALNGKQMELWQLIDTLNTIAGKNGVGLIDHTEDRIVGLKSREYYECPAATVILKAHKDLEKFVCTIHENQFKPMLDQKWAYLAYAGLWYEPLMAELDAYIDKVNEKVNGEVTVKLFKGSAMVVGRKSPSALYNLKLATYEKGQVFNQASSPGFIELFGLQSKMAYQLSKQLKPKK